MDRPGLGAGPVPIGAALRDQAGRFRILEEEQRHFRPMVYWYLTFTCNLACSHCSVGSSPWVDSSADLEPGECRLRGARSFERMSIECCCVE